MTAERLGKVRQVLLLCALAVGVAAMHHVSPASGMPGAAETAVHVVAGPGPADMAPGATGEHHPGMPGGAHDVLHLCLAVLCAAGALLMALAAFLGISWLATTLPGPAGLRGPPRRGRPPGRPGRSILTSLCVSRT